MKIKIDLSKTTPPNIRVLRWGITPPPNSYGQRDTDYVELKNGETRDDLSDKTANELMAIGYAKEVETITTDDIGDISETLEQPKGKKRSTGKKKR